MNTQLAEPGAAVADAAVADAVDVDGVTVRYGNGNLGLDDVSLNVRPGEFMVLIGPSGSGKTTLLRTIAGFLNPMSGSVRMNGETMAAPHVNVPPERRHLGMVFQQHAIWPHMNVGQNVAYPLVQARVPRSERSARVSKALAMVGLDGYADRDPGELSGGQRQRVAIARAVVAEPRMLLLDEALSALDEPLREALRIELKHMTAQLHLTAVHVTHDRGEALALADRIAILDHGRIRQIGTPSELLDNPASPMVAAFLGDATLIPGTCDERGFRADSLPLTVPLDHVAAHGTWGHGVLAVSPHAVSLGAWHGDEGSGAAGSGSGSGAQGASAGAPVVSASLYGQVVNTVVVNWGGLEFRCAVSGIAPRTGEPVALHVGRGMFYLDGADER